MKVLIATGNKDKFRILTRLLSSSGLNNAMFLNLSDIGVNSQIEETGNLANRARQKAQNAYELLDKSLEVDLIVGVDDGMKLQGQTVRTDSKQVTKEILSGAMEIGEEMMIVRAFGFMNSRGEELSTFESEIPFIFVGNLTGITPEENRYPLSQVLSARDDTRVIAEMEEEESNNYYLQYCQEILESQIEIIMRNIAD